MHLTRTSGIAIIVSLLCSLFVAAWSNPQVCYTEKGHLAPDYIVPCFTSYKTSQYSCCKVGDKCLKHNSCYDQDTGVTYEYGCTDPQYSDEACPSKCGLDETKSKWVGLVYCNGTNGLPDETWICHHPDNCKDCSKNWDPELQRMPETSCGDLKHDDQYVAFNEVGFISDLVPLPAQSDMPDYFSRNSDRLSELTATTATTASTTGVATSSVLDQSHSSSTTPLPTASSSAIATPSATPSSAPSKKHTKAIAIGLGVGIPVIIGVGGLFMTFLWRRRREQQRPDEGPDASAGDIKAPDLDGGDGPFGYAHKAELPGEDRPMSEVHGSPSQITEMEGSTIGDRASQISPFVSPLLLQASDKSEGREQRVSGIDSPPQPLHELPG